MGGGRGCYAGQPHSFACAKCRRSFRFRDEDGLGTCGRRYVTTGRMRKQLSQGSNYRHWPEVAYEYRCLDCKHVGWSRHPSVRDKYNREHGKKSEP